MCPPVTLYPIHYTWYTSYRRIIGFPLQDNEAWLVMDYVGGGSVSDILEACEVTLSEAEARECTAWTVLALDYLHSNRKLHRVRAEKAVTLLLYLGWSVALVPACGGKTDARMGCRGFRFAIRFSSLPTFNCNRLRRT